MLALLLVVLLPVVAERLRGGGEVLHTLGSPRDPDSTGSSAGSKSVDRYEGMVAVAEVAEVEEVEAEAVVVVADAEVAEAETVQVGTLKYEVLTSISLQNILHIFAKH